MSRAVQAAQVSDQRTIELIAEILAMPSAFVVVADVSGRLIGALACTPMRERWSRSDDWLLCDEFFVVDPRWTERGLAGRLLTSLEAFADEQQMPLLMGGSLMTSMPLDSLLNPRPGYCRVNAQWLRMPQARANDDSADDAAVARATA